MKDEDEDEKEKRLINNRFITENRYNFVPPYDIIKRTAAEIIGIDNSIKIKPVENETDKALLLKLQDNIELDKRSQFTSSDKENNM